MRHLLSIADLTRADVERILETAEALQDVDEKLPALRGKLVLSLFFESSTRTASSFELAAKRLSADVMSLKAAGSSVDKGESLKDTVLTLAQYDPHAIVVRHPQIGAPALVARYSGAAVVNAGDGKHQHPTQALLDLLTLREALGRLEGVSVAIVGDVLHSRVARSLVEALLLVGAEPVLIAPPTLLPRGIEAIGCAVSRSILKSRITEPSGLGRAVETFRQSSVESPLVSSWNVTVRAPSFSSSACRWNSWSLPGSRNTSSPTDRCTPSTSGFAVLMGTSTGS